MLLGQTPIAMLVIMYLFGYSALGVDREYSVFPDVRDRGCSTEAACLPSMQQASV
jgi:hypothetical protein